MPKAQIVGTGGYQPGEPIDNAMIESIVGPLPEDVLAGVSIQQRYWMIDPATGEHLDSNSGMAVKAARSALESAGLEAAQVELIIVATGTPDYPLPPVANLVQEALGLEECATMELRSAGSGPVQALDIARTWIEQGRITTALVIGSEAISPALAPVFLKTEPAKIRMRDRVPLYMFGDGAGAIVVRAGEGEGLRQGTTRAIGGSRKAGIHAIGGGTHAPILTQQRSKRMVDLRVDVVGAGDFTPVMVTKALADSLAAADLAAEDADWCLIPEGNVGWMLDSLNEAGLLTPEWLALQGRIFDDLAQTGACGCAAVPLFLDHAWRTGMVKPGQKVLLIGVEATKWIYAGIACDWTAEAPA
ncbi:3-oxoacyl-ACP synthase III family protein [Jiangella alkaliphila]|uniref:3-oxoacyl-[acyl-carrier-protein] synthase-3 n=1 Tax=Jiangella alkaliphila TaxID=419479 RepID=A0A1H2I6F5_9ACTN|nr:3-oxoacyl-ACP synthase III family protein [Jiangella alkaliphila]SDU39624.1 3-oxoacyl-[acyl-carrier-protein] synthase-3 [Jiangella alkaliphila]